jgi:hypothetical protein
VAQAVRRPDAEKLMDAVPSLPAPSGARLSGDDYQHLLTWLHAVKLLRGRDGITRVELEARDAGNVDDIVVHRNGRPPLYHQVKFSVDATAPLTHDWFTTPVTPTGKTPLQRFWRSHAALAKEHRESPEMALYTNRPISDGDAVLRHRSGNDATVAQRLSAAPAGSDSGRVRAAWADHLEVTEADLLTMLAHLRIEAGEPSMRHLTESCMLLMELCQLENDEKALLAGCGRIRQLIREGHRSLDCQTIAAIVADLGIEAAGQASRGLLLIEAIDHRPALRDAATITIDWVDHFGGDDPNLRRQLSEPGHWETTLHPELRAAGDAFKDAGLDDVLIAGALRLSTGLAAGAALRGVSGFSVATRNPLNQQEWSSSGAVSAAQYTVTERMVGDGLDIAVALAVSCDPTEDVEAYVRRDLPEVGALITLVAPGGAGRHAVGDSATARGLALAAVDAIRGCARTRRPDRVHVFQCGPLALSVLIGHAWNRMPPTMLYDDLNSAALYTPTFLVRA